jgi:glutathione peroxidase-family protein
MVTSPFQVQHALDIDGNDVAFSQFVGKVVLVVNVASACGYTDQNYRGLELLYEKYVSYGFEILAFPSNQFGGQEPGTDDHIKRFVASRYGVKFRMMSKVDVNGPETSPVFQCESELSYTLCDTFLPDHWQVQVQSSLSWAGCKVLKAAM